MNLVFFTIKYFSLTNNLVGLTGPISKLIEKTLFIVGSFGAFLAIVVLIPKTFGKILLLVVRYIYFLYLVNIPSYNN